MENRRNILWWLVFAVILIAFLWFVPQLQGRYFSQHVKPSDVPALVNEYRRTWAQIIGGFVLLLGLYLTWRRVEISQQTLEASQDQQVTERFTRAIDQLGASDDEGNPRVEIRIGGIYALERIARDSTERDYSTVTEVLMAYVRRNAKWPTNSHTSSQTAEQWEQISGSKLSDETIEQLVKPIGENESREVPADIQAVLSVLGRRNEENIPEQLRVRLSLQRSNLTGADLSKGNFSGADLSDANLSGANLYGANLSQAYFYKTHFLEAHFSNANLSDAMLWETDLTRAIAFEADLSRAALRKAHLSGATLERSNLSGVDLSEADASTIRLVKRDDTSGAVTHTWVQVTNFSAIDLSGADLAGANLSGVDLSGANFSGANLSGANLSGANLTAAVGTTQNQLEQAIGDAHTTLPEDRTMPRAWTARTDNQTHAGESTTLLDDDERR